MERDVDFSKLSPIMNVQMLECAHYGVSKLYVSGNWRLCSLKINYM